MPTHTRRVSTPLLIVLASITAGACADANPTGPAVPKQPAHSITAAAATAWTASGPGTVTLISDGTAGAAAMSYSYPVSADFGIWELKTTTAVAGTATAPWSYNGDNGSGALSTFTAAEAVVNDVVVGVLFSSSTDGAFSFSGTYTFNVQAGDTYGFRFFGTTFEATMMGTFTAGPVTFTTGPGDPATKEDCKNGEWVTYEFSSQGQCVRFVETGTDSR